MADQTDTVMVRPVRTYGGVDGIKHPGDEAYAVSKVRATELRANGLVEYVNAADETASIEAAALASADAVRAGRGPKAPMVVVEPVSKAVAAAGGASSLVKPA